MSEFFIAFQEFAADHDPTKLFSYSIGILTTVSTLIMAFLLYLTRNED